MDLTDTIAPTSDQLDAVDLLSGPRTFTIGKVSKGNAEQPVNIELVEFPRPWRPGKSMRRVLVACWGADASIYVGRRVTLYCDPDVRFGGQAVGGTRISALSHLDKPKQVPLLVSRGKSTVFIVKPLADTPTDDRPRWDEDSLVAAVNAADTLGKLQALWGELRNAPDMPRVKAAFAERSAALKDAAPADDDNQLRDDDPDLFADGAQ